MKTCKAADAPELPQRGRYLTVVAGRAKSRASFCPRHASYRAWETRCFTGRPSAAKAGPKTISTSARASASARLCPEAED